MVTIGIDVSDLRVAKTGQKTYLTELCNAFRKLEQEDAIRSKSAKSVEFIYMDSPFPVIKRRGILAILAQHLFHQAWKQIILPIRAYFKNVDVLFCTDYFAPYIHLKFKTVQVFHDAFFFQNPEHYNRYWLLLHRYLVMPAARKSTFIIVPARFTLQKVKEYTKLSPDKLVCIYAGPKSFTDKLPPKPVTLKLPKYFILHVGVMEKRKNLETLIKAYHLMIHSGNLKRNYDTIKLVLVGQGTGRKESDSSETVNALIEDMGLKENVLLTGYLTDDELRLAYSQAILYVFPSLNEGFGIPVLEAFKWRLPIIVANNSCLPEIGGDGVLSFDPHDVLDLSEKMTKVLNDSTLKELLIERGQKRLQDFSWERSAREMIEVFERAAQ